MTANFRTSALSLVVGALLAQPLGAQQGSAADSTERVNKICEKAAKYVLRQAAHKPDEGAVGSASGTDDRSNLGRVFQILETRPAAAYDIIGSCPNGAGVLAEAWSTPPSDSAELRRLGARSQEVADQRILAVALARLQNANSVPLLRRVALEVVVTQLDRTSSIAQRTWESPETASLGGRAHFDQIIGERPIQASDRERAFAALAEIGRSDPDPRYRSLARLIVASLRTN